MSYWNKGVRSMEEIKLNLENLSEEERKQLMKLVEMTQIIRK